MDLRALLIGGLVPTVLLGLGTVLMKLSMRAGSSVPNYLVQVGCTVAAVGLLASGLGGGWVSTPRATMFAMAMGLAWACAIGAMAHAVSALAIPVSIVAPLVNSNALVALLCSAIVFGEWSQINGLRALLGTVCIAAGAIVVSTAKT